MSGISVLANQGAAVPAASSTETARWPRRPAPQTAPAIRTAPDTSNACAAAGVHSVVLPWNSSSKGPYTHGLSQLKPGRGTCARNAPVSLNSSG